MNPCLACGACCASFRVDFAREEWEPEGGRVPEGLADEITPTLCRLRGTDRQPPRCAALVGTIGEQVHCGIQAERRGPCGGFGAGAAVGVGDEACDAARRRHGLAPL